MEAETASAPELSFSSLVAHDREKRRRKRVEQKNSSPAPVSLASKRGWTDFVSPASSRTSSKRPTLVGQLREERQTWQQKFNQQDEQLVRLSERHYDLQKEMQKKQAEWESNRVHLSQQLQTQTARGDKHCDEVEKYRGERNEAREERDAISRNLATLHEEHSRSLADLTAARATVDQLTKTAAGDLAECNQLRQSATYQLPQGTVKLQQQASRSEVLSGSTGSLEAAPRHRPAHLRATWAALSDLMHEQKKDVIEAKEFLAAHLTEHPEVDPYPAIYVCVNTMHNELEAFVERWLATILPVPGTPGLSLAEELPRHPERAEARIVVKQLNTSSPQEELLAAKEALAMAEKEVELQKQFMTVLSRDTRYGSALHPWDEECRRYSRTVRGSVCICRHIPRFEPGS